MKYIQAILGMIILGVIGVFLTVGGIDEFMVFGKAGFNLLNFSVATITEAIGLLALSCLPDVYKSITH
jgi:hypothetical protein